MGRGAGGQQPRCCRDGSAGLAGHEQVAPGCKSVPGAERLQLLPPSSEGRASGKAKISFSPRGGH